MGKRKILLRTTDTPEPPWLKIILAILAWCLIVSLVVWLVSGAAKAQPPQAIELHIKACYKPDPRVCVDFPPLQFMHEGLTVYACAMRAQPELAKWAKSHPGWYVKRYRCGLAGVFAKA